MALGEVFVDRLGGALEIRLTLIDERLASWWLERNTSCTYVVQL